MKSYQTVTKTKKRSKESSSLSTHMNIISYRTPVTNFTISEHHHFHLLNYWVEENFPVSVQMDSYQFCHKDSKKKKN